MKTNKELSWTDYLTIVTETLQETGHNILNVVRIMALVHQSLAQAGIIVGTPDTRGMIQDHIMAEAIMTQITSRVNA